VPQPSEVHAPIDQLWARDSGQYPGILTEEVVLPVEDHTVQADWEQDQAALSQLPENGGQIVLLPRDAMHQGASPLIGVLATVDGLSRDGEGRWRRARCFGLRRVEVVRTERRGPLLLVQVGEVPTEVEASADDLARLRRLRTRLSRTRHFGSSDPIPDLPDVPLDRLADLLALHLSPGPQSRLGLLTAVSWVDRLPLLERLAKPRRQPRIRRPRARKSPESLEERVEDASLPDAVRRVVERDMAHLDSIHGVRTRQAVEIMLDLVWSPPPANPIDVVRARELMDASHSGLEAAKSAVLDFLVLLEWQRRHGQSPNPGHTLCLVGAPGTGKTTLLEAAAEAMGRRLELIAGGGLDDVILLGADQAYHSARPGEIVRRLQAARAHPTEVVFLLDEIDKVSRWGDHAAMPVLLALLDPAQNAAWQDHFLDGVHLDLSGAVFMATANEKSAIAAPLRDRLRCIDVPPYSRDTQLEIAKSKLLPKLFGRLEITDELRIDDGVLQFLVFDYPHSPGCRQLEQRLQLVVSRGLGLYLEHGSPVAIDADMVRSWLPPESASGIGFHLPSAGVPTPHASAAERVPLAAGAQE
jgi:hypothetical protein